MNLGPRPNVTGQDYVLEIDSETLRSLPIEGLQDICRQLGLAYKPNYTRERLLSKIMGMAVECIDPQG